MRFCRHALVGFVVLLLPHAADAAEAPTIGQVLAVRGPVFRESGGQREAAAPGMALRVADTLVAAPGGKAKLQLNDGSILALGENAHMRIADYQSTTNSLTTRIGLEAGAMRFLVEKTLPGGHFEIETETAVAAVRGTDFLVEATPQRSSVALVAGSVAVRGKGSFSAAEALLTQPGDGTDVAPGAAPSPPVRWGAQRFAATLARASFD
jgi:hypothetical protein